MGDVDGKAVRSTEFVQWNTVSLMRVYHKNLLEILLLECYNTLIELKGCNYEEKGYLNMLCNCINTFVALFGWLFGTQF